MFQVSETDSAANRDGLFNLNYEDGDRGVPGVLQPPNVHLEAAAVVVDGMASAKDHIDQRALRVVGLDAVVPTLF